MRGRTIVRLVVVLGLSAVGVVGAQPVPKALTPSNYILGPDDLLTLRVLDVEEINNLPVRVDLEGTITLPLIGRVPASGLTVPQLEADLTRRLKTYVRQPDVVAAVTEYRSQPVSVVGSVRNPGVHQLQGHKNLIEVLALAGGLNQDAGRTVTITREIEWGAIPLPHAAPDSTGRYSVAEAVLPAIMEGRDPAETTGVRPHDVSSIPRAVLISVTGQVHKAGGFVLNER